MLNRNHAVLWLGLVLTSAAFAQDDDPVPNPPLPVAVKEVFVPVGFDDNDEVQVVLDGYLPDTCYRLAYSQVDFDEESGTFKVRQWARRYDGVCFDTPVPFTTEARLGIVKAGEYQVKNRDGETQPLTVAPTLHAEPDDYLYAPIDNAIVDFDIYSRTHYAIIDGRFTNTCMKFEELRLINSGRTLQLMPIMKMEDRDDCRADEIYFREKVKLPRDMTLGRHLLHVRSLNGQARNVVFTVYLGGTTRAE